MRDRLRTLLNKKKRSNKNGLNAAQANKNHAAAAAASAQTNRCSQVACADAKQPPQPLAAKQPPQPVAAKQPPQPLAAKHQPQPVAPTATATNAQVAQLSTIEQPVKITNLKVNMMFAYKARVIESIRSVYPPIQNNSLE